MKPHKYIPLLLITLLYGCATATVGMSPEQESYFNKLSNKEYANIFSDDEIETKWVRAQAFWKATGLLKTNTKDIIETHRSPDTNITYTVTRTREGDKNKIQMKALLNNPFMSSIAGRNGVLFNEYIETGENKYPGLVRP